MERLNTYFLIGLMLLGSEFATRNLLRAQTREMSPADTTKKTAQKLQPKDEKLKLELPDVLIYGTDRSVRMTGEKLSNDQEDIKLIAPTIDYQSLVIDSNLVSQKNHFQAQQQSLASRTVLEIDAGRYQQLDVMAGRQQQFENYNFSVQCNYSRGEGQYKNSQYAQGGLKAQAGARISPQLVLSGSGSYQSSDYGLYGALEGESKRRITGGKIKISAQWAPAVEQIYDFAIYLHLQNYQERDTTDSRVELIERNIGLSANYQTKYQSLPVVFEGLFDHNKLNSNTENLRIQNFFQLKSYLSIAIKQYAVLKPALRFEFLALSDSFSRNHIAPELEASVTPFSKLGLLFKAGSGYAPMTHALRWEKNPFIDQQVNFIPSKKELELKLGIEYIPSSMVTLHSEIFQQRWNHYGYWFRESETGLFRLNGLGRVTLTILTFQGKVDLSSTMKFDVGIQFAFDKIQDDSLKKKEPHVPYLEKLRLPLNFEYQIDETTQARLSFVWIGARNIYLTDDRKLAKFGLLSAKVEKQFRKNISLYLKGNNLLNQKYQIWQGYPAVKFYFEVGMKANW